MNTGLRSWGLALVVGVVLAAAQPGWAQDAPTSDTEQQARALYEQGLRLYNAGDFTTAAQLWRQAYELNPRPAILHNVAKAFEEGNQLEEALSAWRAYREVAPADQVATADAKIAAIEAAVVVQEAARLETARREALPPPLDELEVPKEPRSRRGLAVGLLGVGALGSVVGGTVLSGSANAGSVALAEDGCVRTALGATLCDGTTAGALSASRLRFGVGVALVGAGVALGAGSVVVAVRPRPDGTVALAMEGTW